MLRRVRASAIPRAAARALNRARNTTRTELVRETQKRIGARNQKRLRRRLLKRLQKNANPRRLRATFTFGTLPIPVGDLIRVPGRGSAVPAGPLGSFPSAFVATMPSGYRGVFERYGAVTAVRTSRAGTQQKQRIRKVTYDIGPTVDSVLQHVTKRIAIPAYRRRYLHELRRELRRARAR